MKENHFSPEDPRLTAYALGQLQGDERAAVEAAIRNDPAAQAFVEQTRAFSAQLESALAHEAADSAPVVTSPLLAPTPASADAINGHDLGRKEGHGPAKRSRAGKLLQFPQLYFVIGSLAAACFAVIVALREGRPTPEVRVYQEIRLKAPAPAVAATEAAPEPPVPAVAAETQGTQKERVEGVLTAARVAVAAAPMEPPAIAPAPEQPGTGLLAQVKKEMETRRTLAMNDARLQSLPHTFGGRAAGKEPGDIALSSEDKHFYANVGKWSATISADAATMAASDSAGAIAPSGRGTEVAGQIGSIPLAANSVATTSSGAATSEAKPEEVVTLSAFQVAPTTTATRDRVLAKREAGSKNRAMGLVSLSTTPLMTESYAYRTDSAFVTPQDSPFSTFAIDVNTASYSNVRRYVQGGRLPPVDAVRIEELLNYFPYHFDRRTAVAGEPTAPGQPMPFTTALEVAQAPWAPAHRLVRIGLKAQNVNAAERPRANLVFLLDVSGSMNSPKKLPLVKRAMRTLLESLSPEDRVAIVTYAGESGLALPSTPVERLRDIEQVIDGLSAKGTTNGGLGLQLAYDIAKANLIPNGINRVILCTDGDFNMGVTSQGALARLVEEKAQSGIALTALGFGMNNLKDSMLELLANKGKGSYGYIDSHQEAEKLLAKQVNGSLVTVAKDVKIQVDFNPAQVSSYRLIGYEDRQLKTAEFSDDAVGGGEVGAGHSVTALYEVVPVGVQDAVAEKAKTTRSKYQPEMPVQLSPLPPELLTVNIRYKEPNGQDSRKVALPVVDSGTKFSDASPDMKFAAAVASYGMILRDSPYRGQATISDVVNWASSSIASPADDPGGYRTDFIELARRTNGLKR